MFLTKNNSVYPPIICGEITLCFVRYLIDKVRTTKCAQDDSWTKIITEKDCCYTSEKNLKDDINF